MTLGKIEVTRGAMVAAALLLFLDKSGTAGLGLLACILHEAGHWWIVRVLGGRVTVLRIGCTGAEMRLSASRTLAPGRLILAALAGPAANLILALAAVLLARQGMGERLYLFAGLNLGLALFNLLPIQRLDGGRVLENLLALLGKEELGRELTGLFSTVASALLVFGGWVLLRESEYRNFSILLAGGWLVWTGLRERRT